jgi:phosphosulfolactate synthase (CoM biosynthesis protein A)
MTQDSFYEKSRVIGNSDLISLVSKMIEAGADIIDIGASSTRPGAQTPSAEEELEDFGNLPSILNPLLIKRLISEVMHSSQQHLLEEDFPEVLPELRKKSQNIN